MLFIHAIKYKEYTQDEAIRMDAQEQPLHHITQYKPKEFYSEQHTRLQIRLQLVN